MWLARFRVAVNRQQQSCRNLPLAGRDSELTANGRFVVFTDWACRHNQDARFRRAGYGAFWADGHPLNISSALGDWSQTNNRAELMAVIACLETDPRPFEIRTDSRYVFNGCTLHLPRRRAYHWRHSFNADFGSACTLVWQIGPMPL